MTNDVILAPKMTQFCPFSPKMTDINQIDPINFIFDQIYAYTPDWNSFDQIYTINDIFDQIYVHKPDWNNF